MLFMIYCFYLAAFDSFLREYQILYIMILTT